LGFRIKSTTETIGSVGGMVLARPIARACGLHRVLERTTLFHDALLGLYGLIVQGCTTFEEITLSRLIACSGRHWGSGNCRQAKWLRIYMER
jgi:hypothetical protein